MEQIKLDLIPGRVPPICHASQYDVGRVIRINLIDDNNMAYTLLGTETVTLGVRKTDGNMVTKTLDVVTGRTYVDMVTTQQMTACAGKNTCELSIVNGTGDDQTTIGTLNFILEVERDPLDGAGSSSTEIENLTAQVYAIVSEQYDSSNVIFDTAPNSEHNIPYVVTSAGVKSAIDGIDVDNLHNVNISNPTNNQVLKYDATNDEWVNGPDVGAIDLNDIRDVDIDSTTLADGDALVYDSTEDKWVNAEAGKKTLAELNDVNLSTTPTDKQVLVYDSNSGYWIAGDGSRLWQGTQAQYDAITTHDPSVVYYITDGQSVTCNMWEGTQSQYESITNPDPATFYFITDKYHIYKNGIEYSSERSIALTQAEYDALKNATPSQLVEGVHYVITDGQDVTCNLGDLNDVDVTGANNGDILVKGASGWEKKSIVYNEFDATIPVGNGWNFQLYNTGISNTKSVIAIYLRYTEGLYYLISTDEANLQYTLSPSSTNWSLILVSKSINISTARALKFIIVTIE